MDKSILEFIRKVKQSESFKSFVDETDINEMNTTSAIDGYNTPYAFAKDEESHIEKTKDALDTYGYNDASKTKKKNTVKMESAYKSMMKSLHEVSYREFKSDQTKPTGRKINDSIKNIDRALREIEKAVHHASRLKNEANVDQRTLWKSSHTRLIKIQDKLVRIGKKINELGA